MFCMVTEFLSVAFAIFNHCLAVTYIYCALLRYKFSLRTSQVLFLVEYDRILSITASESLAGVFIDDVEQYLPSANDPLTTDNLTVAAFTRLIAVQSVATVDTCNGIIGSVTGDFLLTDSTWKCSRYGAEHWYELGFNDSTWPQAFELGLNGPVSGCPGLLYFPTISSQAHWIWTHPDASERTVFCRGYLRKYLHHNTYSHLFTFHLPVISL